jgi:glycosyltransferase involved in cell wall biosynthesis
MSAIAGRISVCLATLNGERFIEPQVQSILLQLRPGDELVISDDGSTDATLDKVRGFSDSRVRVLLSRERGVATNFEHALRHATGDYIFLADQDDVWLPGKVDVMCDALTDKVLAVSDCKVADAELRVVKESYFALVNSGPGFLRNLFRNTYLGCCMAFRRELLELALPIPRGVAHDYWIGMVAELFDHPVFVPRPLLLYRRHRSAASYAGAKSQRRLDTRLAARWVLAMQLAKRLPRIRERRG